MTSWSEVRFKQFIYPAFCNFTENMFFIFGLTKMIDMSMISKALALPICAIFSNWSLLKIKKTFNAKQIGALSATLIASVWLFVSTFNKTKQEVIT